MGFLPWLAILMLSFGYWAQVYKIHKHKEVRDLSLFGYGMLAIGFFIMAIQAMIEDSTLFFVKQIATFVPACIIVYQIVTHSKDKWEDDTILPCRECGDSIEEGWSFCPKCGTKKSY